MAQIPYARLNSIFLDVGGTLISINFDWVCAELQQQGILANTEQLQRAESAARPIISATLHASGAKRSFNVSEFYLTTMIRHLPANLLPDDVRIAQIVRELLPVLYPGENSTRLWSWVLPGVRQALERLKRLELQLVVVSNSDGSIEELLMQKDLRTFFDVVIDSHVVGVEKPDPKIFQIALDQANADRSCTLYVGDLYEVDVLGAQAAGLHALLLDPYSDWQYVDCERLPDLLALCDKLEHAREDRSQKAAGV